MDDRTRLAVLIDELIRSSALKGYEVAEAAQVTPTSVSAWRKGREVPDAPAIGRLAKAMQGKVPDDEIRQLVRVWVELRVGASGRLAWEEPDSQRVREDSQPSLDHIVWRWPPMQRRQIAHLLSAADTNGDVREALLALSRFTQPDDLGTV